MKGAFIVNRYYGDEGMDFVFNSLSAELNLLGIALEKYSPNLLFDGLKSDFFPQFSCDFAIFWDKNIYLAAAMENAGIKIFNNYAAIALCDDKQKTYAALKNIRIPKTITPPLMYDNCLKTDSDFLDFVEKELGFPLIAKENVGSQGRQVFLAESRAELDLLYERLRHKPHHYQEFIGEFGMDLRLYMVGGDVAAAYYRKGEGFKSNLYNFGSATRANPDKKTTDLAKKIADTLGLDFGAIDFLLDNGNPVFLEANSSAYFRGAENLGFKVAKKIAEYIEKRVK